MYVCSLLTEGERKRDGACRTVARVVAETSLPSCLSRRNVTQRVTCREHTVPFMSLFFVTIKLSVLPVYKKFHLKKFGNLWHKPVIFGFSFYRLSNTSTTCYFARSLIDWVRLGVSYLCPSDFGRHQDSVQTKNILITLTLKFKRRNNMNDNLTTNDDVCR